MAQAHIMGSQTLDMMYFYLCRHLSLFMPSYTRCEVTMQAWGGINPMTTLCTGTHGHVLVAHNETLQATFCHGGNLPNFVLVMMAFLMGSVSVASPSSPNW